MILQCGEYQKKHTHTHTHTQKLTIPNVNIFEHTANIDENLNLYSIEKKVNIQNIH